MKSVGILKILFVLLVVVSAMTLLAQNATDDQGSPNNPQTNARANACYAGGSLAGKCDFEWKWVCGWGIVRVEQGLLPREVLSAACQSLMPAPLPTYTPGPSSSKGAAATAVPLPTLTPSKPK